MTANCSTVESSKSRGWLLLRMRSPPSGTGRGVRVLLPPSHRRRCPPGRTRARSPWLVQPLLAGSSGWAQHVGLHGSSVSQGLMTPTGIWWAPPILLLNTAQGVGGRDPEPDVHQPVADDLRCSATCLLPLPWPARGVQDSATGFTSL